MKMVIQWAFQEISNLLIGNNMNVENHIKNSLLCVVIIVIIAIMIGFVIPYCISSKNTLYVIGGFIALAYTIWLVIHGAIIIYKIIKSKWSV